MAIKLEKMLQQKAELEARIRLTKALERKRDRKTDTRKKILLGAYVLEEMEKDEKFKAEMLDKMNKFLTRDIDRDVFFAANVTEETDAPASKRAEDKRTKPEHAEASDRKTSKKAERNADPRPLVERVTAPRPTMKEEELGR